MRVRRGECSYEALLGKRSLLPLLLAVRVKALAAKTVVGFDI